VKRTRIKGLRRVLAYLVAVLGVGVAFVARAGLAPLLGDAQPYVTFYLPVIIAAWWGGIGPSLLALALGGLLADYYFVDPHGALWMTHWSEGVATILYVFVGLTTVGFSEAMRRAEGRAEEQARAVREGEAALRASESQLNGIIASAGDAIITIDAAQTIRVFNAEAEAVFGYSADEMIGQPLDALIPERFREAHRGHVRTFGLTDAPTRRMGGERLLAGRRRNGDEFPIEARISQTKIGGRTLSTVVLRDVAERKRTEALIAAHLGALQRLHDITPVSSARGISATFLRAWSTRRWRRRVPTSGTSSYWTRPRDIWRSLPTAGSSRSSWTSSAPCRTTRWRVGR
jgi:PAS domain S-box-containing protein